MLTVTPIVASFSAVSIFVVLVRLYLRVFVIKKFGFDDAFIILASLAAIVTMVSVLYASRVETAMGNMDIIVSSIKAGLVMIASYWISTWAIKMSVLTFCLGIFKDFQKRRVFVIVCMGLITAQFLAAFFTGIFQCTPMSNSWNLMTYPQGCIDLAAASMAHACIGLATDILVYCLPIVLLNNALLDRRRKIFLSVIFGLGGIALVGAAGRIAAINAYNHSQTNEKWVLLITFTTIEADIGIIACSLPALSPLLRSTWRSVKERSSFRGSKYMKSNGGSNSTGQRTRNAQDNQSVQALYDQRSIQIQSEGQDSRQPSQGRNVADPESDPVSDYPGHFDSSSMIEFRELHKT